MTVKINGAKLRAYRESLHYTREDVCGKTDISVRYLSDLENGIPHKVSVDKLYPVCMLLGVKIDDVIIIYFNASED